MNEQSSEPRLWYRSGKPLKFDIKKGGHLSAHPFLLLYLLFNDLSFKDDLKLVANHHAVNHWVYVDIDINPTTTI
jgi:hypothetical protein